jgi:methyl-accepting chemotaxis protein PixJ
MNRNTINANNAHSPTQPPETNSLEPLLENGQTPSQNPSQTSSASPVKQVSHYFDRSGFDRITALPRKTSPPSSLLIKQTNSVLTNELMTGILPWVVAPMGIVALVSYVTATQGVAKQTQQKLQDQTLAVSWFTRDHLQGLNQSGKLPTGVAPDGAAIEFSTLTPKHLSEGGHALHGLPVNNLSESQQVQILGLDNTGTFKVIGTLTADGLRPNAEIVGGDEINQRASDLVRRQQEATQETSSTPTGVSRVYYGDGTYSFLSTLTHESRLYTLATIPGTKWVAITSIDRSEMLTSPLWAAGLAATVVSLIGVTIFMIRRSARRMSGSLDELSQVFQQIATGNTSIQLQATKLGSAQNLARNFNHMASKLQSILQAQAETMERSQFYTDVATAANRGDYQTVFDLVVHKAKEVLMADRVVVYQFAPDWHGEIVAEALNPKYPSALHNRIMDPCIPRAILDEYHKGRILPVNNVDTSTFSVEHKQLLTRLEVKAKVVMPVVANDRLLGLLITHQCSETRIWKASEIDFLQQLAIQAGTALSSAFLAAEKTAEAERTNILKDVTLRIHQAINLENLVELGVSEIRQAMNCDRVLLCRLNSDFQSATLLAESSTPDWQQEIDPSLSLIPPDIVEQLSTGQLWRMESFQTVELSPEYRNILEGLQVWAALAAPLMSNGKLYGVLWIHQCAKPRFWPEEEVNLLAQLTNVLGFAIDRTILQQQQQEAARRSKQLTEMTLRMRRSLNRQYIFNTVVGDTRQALKADRAIIYLFDKNWQGKVLAESVLPDYPAALGAKIADPCFATEYVEKYKRGRVHALSNIDTAEIDPCYKSQLEPMQVKANIVAPILVDNRLLGLLVVHQCSGPRIWRSEEISFLQQIAIQLGFALDQAALLLQQQKVARYAQYLNEITLRMRESLNRQEIFEAAVEGMRTALAADRVLVYQFDDKWQGTVVAETVGKGFPIALGQNIADPCFAESYIEQYKLGRVQALSNIYEANLDPCYMSQLEPFQVKANVVAPILVEENLLGLFVAHQCSAPRRWKEEEINLIRQVGIQLGFALEQSMLLEQREQARLEAENLSQVQQQKTEVMQQQLIELLSDVEGAAMGNLTVRAEVTTGEIGTVADFFNSIVESLRQIVTQVKQSALQVNAALGENEGAIAQLAEEALRQSEETTLTLRSVEEMTESLQNAAQDAQQAAEVAQTASASAEASGLAMDLTVRTILNLRETIGETAKKVKRLGESSQQISRVVSLINQIALQTNLLAINAGIEAARAGGESQGFAVIAEEVGELAARSAAATREIEQMVDTIQRETSEVVQAMEQGTVQIVEGTQSVENAKQNLEQIQQVSRQIDTLVKTISNMTGSQVQTAQTIASLMEEVAQVAERTSSSSYLVSGSLRQTVAIAKELQQSVEMFRVE